MVYCYWQACGWSLLARRADRWAAACLQAMAACCSSASGRGVGPAHLYGWRLRCHCWGAVLPSA
eukprot:15461403-Alexandrium_andersonii.AAC.1